MHTKARGQQQVEISYKVEEVSREYKKKYGNTIIYRSPRESQELTGVWRNHRKY